MKLYSIFYTWCAYFKKLLSTEHGDVYNFQTWNMCSLSLFEKERSELKIHYKKKENNQKVSEKNTYPNYRFMTRPIHSHNLPVLSRNAQIHQRKWGVTEYTQKASAISISNKNIIINTTLLKTHRVLIHSLTHPIRNVWASNYFILHRAKVWFSYIKYNSIVRKIHTSLIKYKTITIAFDNTIILQTNTNNNK